MMSTFKATFNTNSNFNATMRTSVSSNSNVKVATTEEWNSKIDLIGTINNVYVYTDARLSELGTPLPAYKVGDGVSYLIDLPFNDDIAQMHFNNSDIHITNDEREFWNNKVTAFIDAYNLENLVLSKGPEPID